MTETQTTQTTQTTTEQSLKYAPSSLEKKRAVVMYGLFGIIIMIGKKEMNQFEYFHLKQAAGWWISFIFFFIVSSVIFFIPVIKFLGLIPLLAMIVVWVIFVKQAWDGKFDENQTKGPLQVFSGIWIWLLDLFEVWPKTDSPKPPIAEPDMFVWWNNQPVTTIQK